MWIQNVQRDAFLRVMERYRDEQNSSILTEQLREQWTPRQICQLLRDKHSRTRRLACDALGLIADHRVSASLAQPLKDDDEQVGQAAEQALWAIWFRAGNDEAQSWFRRGLQSLEADRPQDAVRYFFRAQRRDPAFAEAYHQAAIAFDMLGQWDKMMLNCWHVIGLIPCHFAAWSALGHCYTHLDEMQEAVECYRQALRINPNLGDVAFALGRLQHSLSPVHAAKTV